MRHNTGTPDALCKKGKRGWFLGSWGLVKAPHSGSTSLTNQLGLGTAPRNVCVYPIKIIFMEEFKTNVKFRILLNRSIVAVITGFLISMK